MNRSNKIYKILIVFLLVCLFGIGYATLVSNININGYAKFRGVGFDVHFENIQVTNGSVTINTTAGDSAATIEPTNRTRVDYSVTLSKPGDFYEFTVDVVNDGTIDAMINLVTSKMNNTVINNNLPSYLEYNVTYVDGTEMVQNHELNSTQTETYKVRIAFKTNINPSDLPTTTSTLNFSFNVNYIQKTNSSSNNPEPSELFVYTTSHGQIGGEVPAEINETPEDAMNSCGYNVFFKHKIENNEIVESYLGFRKDNTIYYLKGGDGGESYNDNISILLSVFGSSNCNDYENDNSINCTLSSLTARAKPSGHVYGYDGNWKCTIYSGNVSSCELMNY